MEKQKALGVLRELAADPSSYLKSWKAKTGRKILGYFCTNTPEEMIQAAGLLPVRILSSRDTISLASRHLQSYSCSLVQSSLESALRGELSFLEGTVFPHTCDSIQRLSDIWAENLRFPFHWDLVLPVKLHTESARCYLISELARFRKGLEDFVGHTIPDDDLREAISLFNENRSLLRQVSRCQAANPARFPPRIPMLSSKRPISWPRKTTTLCSKSSYPGWGSGSLPRTAARGSFWPGASATSSRFTA